MRGCEKAAMPAYRLVAASSGYSVAIKSVFAVIVLKSQIPLPYTVITYTLWYSSFSTLLLAAQWMKQTTYSISLCVKVAKWHVISAPSAASSNAVRTNFNSHIWVECEIIYKCTSIHKKKRKLFYSIPLEVIWYFYSLVWKAKFSRISTQTQENEHWKAESAESIILKHVKHSLCLDLIHY